MAYVFRPHKGNNNLDGWDDSAIYDKSAIDSIQDPNGGSANIPITSIPSPFASMELVKSAYAYCADKNNNVDGTTIFHKMVSFSLDVLEIMFGYEKYSNKVQLIPWYKSDLDNLINHYDDDIRRLGETLQLYLKQDSDAFHFDTMDAIYMLNYIDGRDPINIVGGTSPTSLAIASANNLDFVELYLGNNHRAFNSDEDTFCSLCHRDPAFIKYIYTMSKQQNFSTLYPEVNKYIQKCYAALRDQSLRDELRQIQMSDYDMYPSLLINGQTAVFLPGNIPARMQISVDLTKSDFLISISDGKNPDGELPLVLPYSTYTEPGMKYVTGLWNSKNKAPLMDNNDIQNRSLPFDGTKYPYLTVNDVFQPYIMKTVFPISENAFFTANCKASDKGYLLPLRPTILNYLSIEDLKGYTNEVNSLPICEIKEVNNSTVKAIIRIPIQKGKYITFERNYFKEKTPQPESNTGSIMECRFNMFLFPSYRINKPNSPQRIYIIDQDTGPLTKNYKYTVTPYQEDNSVEIDAKRIDRADKSKYSYSSFYYAMKEEYGYLIVSNGKAENIVIPNFIYKSGGTRKFEFAVDFGTTNTHIEWREDGGSVKPLEINIGKPHVLILSDTRKTSEENLYEKMAEFMIQALHHEFIPESISKGGDFSFPMRTNLSKVRDANFGQRKLVTLADYSLYFGYEKFAVHRHNEILTDLKWGHSRNDSVNAYIEELLLLIRNTVVLEGGDLDKTQVKWFYPISMPPFLKTRLETSWDTLSQEIISPHCVTTPISESVAPFYYYKNEEGVNSRTCPVVSVDIGGGTSDFVAYQGNEPLFISSVRFAGNNIFGDFLGMSAKLNGFYKLYKDEFESRIAESTQKDNLKKVFDDIVANNNTADFVSFLFSLEHNARLNKSGENISFSRELEENYKLKIVFLLFYTAIVYYIAMLLRKKGLTSPGYITFSGTASKMFSIIGGVSNLQRLTKSLFNKLFNSDHRLELKRVKNPKEITCQGGLKMSAEEIAVTPSKEYFYGAESLDNELKIFANEENLSKKLVVEEVLDSYYKFIDFFFELNNDVSYSQYFGIEDNGNFNDYKRILKEHAEEDFATVLEDRLKDFQEADVFEDSLFFYPLCGGIFRLAQYIADNK